jgi:Domain of unknown function (DUF4157)
VPAVVSAAAKDVMPSQKPSQNELNESVFQDASIQFKLALGTADDPLEHEADAMADTVLRMPEQHFIQRKCSQCEEEEKLQRKPLASFIQRKESSRPGAVASDAISNQINASRGNGSNMDRNTQSFMQSRFGADFSDVKIHTGSEAVQMNRELNAKAFTVGNDIYFNEGQHQPGSQEGKHLLAHELTHVIQQGKSTKSSKVIQRKSIDDFRSILEAKSDNHKKVIEALFKHPKFIPLVDYVRKCPGGTIDFRVERITQRINGVDVDLFGGFGTFGTSDLTVNPDRAEHATNPLEMVDTIVHEMIHAILNKNSVCTSATNPFPLAPGIHDRDTDPELAALQAGTMNDIFGRKEAASLSAAGNTTASGTDLLDYFNQNYGPSASRPETHYVDLNKEGLKLVVSIISDIKKAFPAIGKKTVSFDNVELLDAEPLVASLSWVSAGQQSYSRKLFKDQVAKKRKIDDSTFTDREYDISAVQVVEFADNMQFDENADGHWGVSGGVWECSKRSRFTGKRLNTYVTGSKSKRPGKGVGYKIIQHT